jgi:hypothetical protein
MSSLAGVYKLVTQMFHTGKRLKPGELVTLSHEDAALGLKQGTIKRPDAGDQKAASEAAFARMPAQAPTGLGGGSPPELVEQLRREAEARKLKAAEEQAAAEATKAPSTEPAVPVTAENAPPEGKGGGKKAK